MTVNEMETRLRQFYPGCDVVVSDMTGTGDHYEVRIAASEFTGLSRLEQHKAVMKVFDQELKSGEVHALAIKTLAK